MRSRLPSYVRHNCLVRSNSFRALQISRPREACSLPSCSGSGVRSTVSLKTRGAGQSFNPVTTMRPSEIRLLRPDLPDHGSQVVLDAPRLFGHRADHAMGRFEDIDYRGASGSRRSRNRWRRCLEPRNSRVRVTPTQTAKAIPRSIATTTAYAKGTKIRRAKYSAQAKI